MLRRKPTRVELTTEDKKELDELELLQGKIKEKTNPKTNQQPSTYDRIYGTGNVPCTPPN